ncbi:MAG: small multi-drug export protein, partial [Muricoprocola sp.]
MNGLSTWIIQTFGGFLSKEALVFLISMTPILELRGGLLAASYLGVDMLKAIGICVIGNIIPVPFILLLITPIFA